jgi:hypothetical protein
MQLIFSPVHKTNTWMSMMVFSVVTPCRNQRLHLQGRENLTSHTSECSIFRCLQHGSPCLIPFQCDILKRPSRIEFDRISNGAVSAVREFGDKSKEQATQARERSVTPGMKHEDVRIRAHFWLLHFTSFSLLWACFLLSSSPPFHRVQFLPSKIPPIPKSLRHWSTEEIFESESVCFFTIENASVVGGN